MHAGAPAAATNRPGRHAMPCEGWGFLDYTGPSPRDMGDSAGKGPQNGRKFHRTCSTAVEFSSPMYLPGTHASQTDAFVDSMYRPVGQAMQESEPFVSW